MTKLLTTEETALLQRYYDGELVDAEVSRAQELLTESQVARVFMSALEELTLAAQAAEDVIWASSNAPAASVLVEHAMKAASMVESPLSDLAPLLERFFDGEVVLEEMAIVQALIDEREDVAEYLANLDSLRSSLRAGNDALVEGASFDGFWDSLEARIDAEEATFDADEHRVLLYRYHDGEVTEREQAQVDAWVGAGNGDVIATLAALAELRLAAVASIELAQERADLSGLWPAVEDALDDAIEAQGENVVSMAREKRERTGGALRDYRQAVFGALAAMVCVALVAGLLKDQIRGERVIVEKTVVIVDSVEYQPGSSVMVNAPMRPVSSISTADDAAEAEEEPTVIWLLDNGDDPAPSAGTEDNTEDIDTGDEGDQPI